MKKIMKKRIIPALGIVLLLTQSCQNDDKFLETQSGTKEVVISSKASRLRSNARSEFLYFDNSSDTFEALKENADHYRPQPVYAGKKFAGIVITNNSNMDLSLDFRKRSGLMFSPYDDLSEKISKGKSIGFSAAGTTDLKGAWSFKIIDTDQYFNVGVDLSDGTDIKLRAQVSEESNITNPLSTAVTGVPLHNGTDIEANALIIETDDPNYYKVHFVIDKKVIATRHTVGKIVDYLASDELGGRFIGTEGYEKAGTFIENEFRAYGIAPYFQSYRDDFSIERTLRFDLYGWESESFNVVGYLEGTDPILANEYVLIGAHLDSDYTFTNEIIGGDEIKNGANDNATGCAAVLALAKYIADTKSNKRSVIFALFGAEEIGIHGSNFLAKKLKERGLNLYTMINFEMIGVPLNGKSYTAYLTGYDMSNMAQKINEYADRDNLIGSLSGTDHLFQLSDNYPFYTEFGVPSQTISSYDFTNYPYYHKVSDEVSKLDYNYTSQLINDLTPAIVQILNTPSKEISMTQD